MHVYAPDGHLIGRLKFQLVVNLYFGGPQYKTLYMVGQPLVTSIPVLVSGPLALKKLQIKNENGHVTLSWPAPSTGWTLQETEDLESPASWTNSSLPIVTINNQNTVNVDTISSTAKYFRLLLN